MSRGRIKPNTWGKKTLDFYEWYDMKEVLKIVTGRNAVMFHFYFMTSKYNLRLVAGSRKAPEAVTSLFSARRIFYLKERGISWVYESDKRK